MRNRLSHFRKNPLTGMPCECAGMPSCLLKPVPLNGIPESAHREKGWRGKTAEKGRMFHRKDKMKVRIALLIVTWTVIPAFPICWEPLILMEPDALFKCHYIRKNLYKGIKLDDHSFKLSPTLIPWIEMGNMSGPADPVAGGLRVWIFYSLRLCLCVYEMSFLYTYSLSSSSFFFFTIIVQFHLLELKCIWDYYQISPFSSTLRWIHFLLKVKF